jgi:AcrR family transcriptional regulator
MTTDSRISRRDEYAAATRAALLEAARAQFTEVGYQEAGIEALARAARVTKGALYHHFPDKRAVFDAVVVTLQEDVAARVSQAAGRTSQAAGRRAAAPLDRLQAGCEAFLELCCEPSYRRLVIEEAPAVLGTARCREIESATSIGLLVGGLRALAGAGVLAVRDHELVGRMLASMICEAALLLARAPERAGPRRREAIATVRRLLDGLRAGRA